MKVVVFGGSGFLGSHVADYLSKSNHEVTVFDLKLSPYLKESQKMILGDILDFDAVSNACNGADAVYNFAAIADIDTAHLKPRDTIVANIVGNTNILDACRVHGVKRYIFASTVYVYSEAGSFYRASKQSCELVTECYHKHCGLDFTILRYGSLYGPRANDSNWVHGILKQALVDGKISRKGDGEEIREYIHVYDAARLSAKVLDDEFKNQYVMITGQQPMRIKDVLVMVKEMLNGEIDLEFLDADYEDHYEITPYNFRPKLAKKITDSGYVDLGQGILDLLDILYNEKQNKNQRDLKRV